MTTLTEIRANALRSLIPPPRLRLSEWIEREIVLPEGTSALPGRVRLWPYQREIADAISDPEIERVTLVKPVRVGFTTLLTGAIASFVVNEPAPILLLEPTDSDARDAVVSDIEPVFAATPILRGTLSDDAVDGERNTLTSRRFPGGSLRVIASRAPRNLRRLTARVLLVDEADAMEAGTEGNPIRLAERRTLSFANRKIILGSTPLFEDTSHVLRSYAESDARVFEVGCIHCQHRFEVTWACIQWPEGRPAEAYCVCPSCGAVIEERHKAGMVEAGQWRATRPDIKGHAGFRLNALVSLLANASWGKLATEFLQARESPEDLQTFVNTILGQGWREQGAELDETALAARAEPFGLDKIPADVLIVTAGIDLQDDRAEITICGWSRDSTALVLGHIVIWGSPDDDSFWFEIDELLKTRWQHPHGGRIGVDACAVDSGDGGWTSRVYDFCFPRARRILAVKGASGARPAIQVSHSKVKRSGGKIWIVGADTIKTTIFNRLQRGASIRFSASLEPVYYEQLASERKVIRYSRGQPVRRFERIAAKRAEALDCLCYAFAARSAVTVQLDSRADELRSPVAPKPPPAVVRSKFMER